MSKYDENWPEGSRGARVLHRGVLRAPFYERPSRASFMHASMPFDAKCSTRRRRRRRWRLFAFETHRRILRIIRLLSTSQVVLFSYSYTVCHGGGDTVVVLSLYLGPLLLKYRILPGRDRFPRVNDTKIVCRPREGGGGGGEGGTHAEQSRAPTLFVTPSFTSRSNVEPNCSTREEFPANYDELRIRFSYSPIFICIDVGRKGKREGQWYASLIYISMYV